MKNLWKGISWLIVLVVALTMLSATAVAEAEPGLPDVAAQESPVSVLTVNALKPIVTETGKISLSLDGLGSNSASGIIQVEKPAGATVRKAYMAAASMGTSSGFIIPNGGITIDGVGVTWDSTKTMSCQLGWSPSCYNHWADITSMVKPKIDAAAPGRVSFTVTESSTSRIDGEILAVIFDDPGQTTDNTVILLYGAQSYAGDTFAITLAEPIDKTDPNLKMDFSLGISYGYQTTSYYGQHSQVDVNSRRLTTSAGGQDDGVPITIGNGGLLTVGGLDDSNANPPNPYATGSSLSPRYDDELYNLLPFVNTGDASITVYTRNPSTDDNIFFAALNIRSAVAIVGEGIVLAPLSDSNPVGSEHTLTATVKDDLGRPVVGRLVTFRVVSGPHAGLTGTGTTDINGQATYTYTGTSGGTDTIEASFVNSQGATQTSNRVTKEWVVTNNPPVANPNGPYTGNEGSAIQFDGLASSDPDGDSLTYAWDFGDGATASGATPTHAYADNGAYAVTLTVTDTQGASNTASTTATVSNVAPAIDAGADAMISEGGTFSSTGSFSDPGADTWTATIDYGDSSGDQPLPLNPDKTFSLSHTYADNGNYVVTVTVTDDDGGVGSDTATVTVNNVAPTVNAGTDATIDEGSTFSSSGFFSDPGADIWTATVNYGDSSGDQLLPLNPDKTFSLSHTYVDNGIYTVTVTVTDDDGGVGSATATVTVNNVAPVVEAGLDQTVYSGDTVSFSGSFTDPGTVDTHTYAWDFDDSSSATSTLTPTHVYLPVGTYIVTLTVTDDDGGIGSDTLTVTVIPIPVTIDIKPGSFPNSINLGNEGTVPVAIFSTENFDATTVNPLTVTLASAPVKLKGKGTPMASKQDVNGDGLLDLVVHVSTSTLDLSQNDVAADLEGQTYDWKYIKGSDSVRIVPP